MPSNLFAKLLSPRFPSAAAGIEKEAASVVQLERERGGFVVRRAASINLPADLLRPSFDESNITEPSELVEALAELQTSAGLLRQRKWSVTLPEATVRSVVMTLEGTAASHHELEEVLEWKTERSFGAPLEEMRVARELLTPNAQKQPRYLVTAVRLAVLAEYETVFAALGWQAGLILPRHAGEEQWLRNGQRGDGLLLTAHEEGFTAVLMRDNRPLTLRSVFCESADCDDELHRVLLFYRERSGTKGKAGPSSVDRLLVVGESLDKNRVAEIARETLGVTLVPLAAPDIGLVIPGDLAFDLIAAPAGLARLAW